MTNYSTPTRVAVLLTTVVVALVLLLANTVGASGPETDATVVSEVASHRVVGGDTLWDIAAAHTAAGDDVRHTVFVIQKHNELADSVIVPGQVLEIPLSG